MVNKCIYCESIFYDNVCGVCVLNVRFVGLIVMRCKKCVYNCKIFIMVVYIGMYFVLIYLVIVWYEGNDNKIYF